MAMSAVGVRPLAVRLPVMGDIDDTRNPTPRQTASRSSIVIGDIIFKPLHSPLQSPRCITSPRTISASSLTSIHHEFPTASPKLLGSAFKIREAEIAHHRLLPQGGVFSKAPAWLEADREANRVGFQESPQALRRLVGKLSEEERAQRLKRENQEAHRQRQLALLRSKHAQRHDAALQMGIRPERLRGKYRPSTAPPTERPLEFSSLATRQPRPIFTS